LIKPFTFHCSLCRTQCWTDAWSAPRRGETILAGVGQSCDHQRV